MNIYLDIDGVLLHDSLSNNGAAVDHAVELLKEVTSKHKCFWLTTHCRGGENRAPEYLSSKLPLEAKEYIDKIIPTDWSSWKTEAIDFSQDFRWIDDDVYNPEREALEFHNCLDKLIFVNVQENPNQLLDVIKQICS